MFPNTQLNFPQAPKPTGSYKPIVSTNGVNNFFGKIASGIKNFFTPNITPRLDTAGTQIPLNTPTTPSTRIQNTIPAQPVQISINTPQPNLQASAPSTPTVAENNILSSIPTPTAFNIPMSKDGTIPSSILNSNTTYADVLNKRREYENQYAKALQDAADISVRGLRAVENARYSGETLGFAQGMTEREQRNANLDSLAATGRAEAFGKLLDANQQTINNLRPDIVGSPQIDQMTGNVFVTTRNPSTGLPEVVNAGNIGPQKSYVSSSVQQDPATKQLIFTGIKPDGSVETKVLSEGSTDQQGGVLNTLPTSVQTKVISIANDFGTTDIVKRFNATVDGINIVSSIPPNSKNPADHQSIIYAFAKSLDPDSAVKEGEYDTIKKYAQSTISKYGKEISNAINGTGFLSAKAIENIKTTMNNNYQSRKPTYDNLYNEKSRIINNIAGTDVAKDLMVDYSQGAARVSGKNIIETKIGPVDNSWFE